MMLGIKKIFIILFCVTLPLLTNAADFIPNNNPAIDQAGDELTLIANYLRRLGQYMGYDLEQDSPDADNLNDTLLTYLSDNDSKTLGQKIFEQTAWVTILGAIPVNASSDGVKNFVPTSNESNVLNTQANYTFENYTKSDSTGISIIPEIDHKDYLSDPGSQSSLNILSTMDPTFCQTSDSTSSDTSNTCLSTKVIMDNVLADIMKDNVLPGSKELYAAQNLASLAGQLNSNTLTAPLLYDVDGSSTSSSEKSNALPSKTQAQQAGNFIRYVINELSPEAFVDAKKYSDTWSVAYSEGDATLSKDLTKQADQIQARTDLSTYLTKLRAFTAQSSIAMNNLYGILSKRMAQSTPADSSKKSSTSSQALSEYQMASWRIYDTQHKEQWMDQLNTASSATVQKEIAILLSEINYQLYLNRQQEEKILLTNTVQLLQALSNNKPGLNSSTFSTSTNQG